MKRIRIRIGAILLFAGLIAMPAKGDGGRVQMHERAGPYVVTLFSMPDALVTGPADLSVGVEDAETGELLRDAEVTLTLNSPGPGSTHGIVSRATRQTTRQSATAGILQAAQVTFPSAGQWRIIIDVKRQGRTGRCSKELTVGVTHQRAYEIGTAGAAPLMVGLLFVLHERRKRKWEQERTIRTRDSSVPIA